MNAVRHADLARELILACGGFEAAALVCRLKKTQLQRCCDAGSGRYLPIDVVNDLELACKRRIYMDALRDAADRAPGLEDLVTEACEMTEVSAEAQRLARSSTADRRLNAHEKKRLRRAAIMVRAQAHDFCNAVDQVTA